MDNTTTKSSALIRIEVVTSQLAVHHLTNGMDKIPMVKVLKPVLVRIVCVGAMVKLVRRRVLNPILIVSVLRVHQNTWNDEDKKLTQYSSSLNMKGVMAQP